MASEGLDSCKALEANRRAIPDNVMNSWTAFRIAWILCVDYGGDWVAWNLVKSRFLESASETKMYMADENVFKHTLLTMIYDYGLIEADEYPQDPHAWEKCIEERRRRAEKDKRIKKSPEEYCRNKVRRVVNVKATLTLCQLLLRAIRRKSTELGIVAIPPRLLDVTKKLCTDNPIGESRDSERDVVEYTLEDPERKVESGEVYTAERTVLSAIEKFFAESSNQSLEGDHVAVFTAKELQSVIIMERLREEDCLEIVDREAGEKERVKPECRRRAEELRREWSPQRIGRILERMGLSEYKKIVGKGVGARRVYTLPKSVYEEKLRLYGVLGSAESAKCLGEGDASCEHLLTSSRGKGHSKDLDGGLWPGSSPSPGTLQTQHAPAEHNVAGRADLELASVVRQVLGGEG